MDFLSKGKNFFRNYRFVNALVGYYAISSAQIQTTAPSEKITANNTTKTSAQMIPNIPVRLNIPIIGVDAPIIQTGLTANGAVGVPEGPKNTAWFNVGPKPGQSGSAIITGHFGPWRDGSHSVFDNLYKLKIGDKIFVQDQKGQIFTFLVIDKKTYNANAKVPEIFNKTDGSYLNIITCSGDWLANEHTYNQRLVIFTKAE